MILMTTQITETLKMAKRAALKGDITILGSWAMGERYLLVDFVAVTVQLVEGGEMGEVIPLWESPGTFMASCMRDSGYRVVV
jgi:hypothetical protein